jgi:hypothetical protein
VNAFPQLYLAELHLRRAQIEPFVRNTGFLDVRREPDEAGLLHAAILRGKVTHKGSPRLFFVLPNSTESFD